MGNISEGTRNNDASNISVSELSSNKVVIDTIYKLLNISVEELLKIDVENLSKFDLHELNDYIQINPSHLKICLPFMGKFYKIDNDSDKINAFFEIYFNLENILPNESNIDIHKMYSNIDYLFLFPGEVSVFDYTNMYIKTYSDRSTTRFDLFQLFIKKCYEKNIMLNFNLLYEYYSIDALYVKSEDIDHKINNIKILFECFSYETLNIDASYFSKYLNHSNEKIAKLFCEYIPLDILRKILYDHEWMSSINTATTDDDFLSSLIHYSDLCIDINKLYNPSLLKYTFGYDFKNSFKYLLSSGYVINANKNDNLKIKNEMIEENNLTNLEILYLSTSGSWPLSSFFNK